MVAAIIYSPQAAARTTEYLAGAHLVDRLLRGSKSPVKEVYWITDDQSDAWATSKKESARATWAEMGDPVAIGAAATLERPGANLTGVTTSDPELPVRQS